MFLQEKYKASLEDKVKIMHQAFQTQAQQYMSQIQSKWNSEIKRVTEKLRNEKAYVD